MESSSTLVPQAHTRAYVISHEKYSSFDRFSLPWLTNRSAKIWRGNRSGDLVMQKACRIKKAGRIKNSWDNKIRGRASQPELASHGAVDEPIQQIGTTSLLEALFSRNSFSANWQTFLRDRTTAYNNDLALPVPGEGEGNGRRHYWHYWSPISHTVARGVEQHRTRSSTYVHRRVK
jgi:hypothetical protein